MDGPGNVVATGGMVAKFVGVTFTTVVATPRVSDPHEVSNDAATSTAAVPAVENRIRVNTATERRWRDTPGRGSRPDARITPTDGPSAEWAQAAPSRP